MSIVRAALLSVALAVGQSAPSTAQSAAPSIDDLLNLARVGSPVISPDGRAVAYTLRETNWEDNEYETEIWIGTATDSRRVTNARKSSQNPPGHLTADGWRLSPTVTANGRSTGFPWPEARRKS
jgi:dipeptidyl aminopeptidase/acylaminoacyl peptidase